VKSSSALARLPKTLWPARGRSTGWNPPARRQGVASALVAEFLAWARRKHANEVKVTAYAANDAAIAFYRRQGFVPFESTLLLTQLSPSADAEASPPVRSASQP